MNIRMYLVSFGFVLLTGCGGGEITNGDIYSACVDGQLREFDAKVQMVMSIVEDNEKAEQEKFWAKERRKTVADAEKSCACSAEQLPNRIERDRLSSVIAFYKSQGTMSAKKKFDVLTETEQTEMSKCLAEVKLERMKREGLVD